MTDMRKTVDSPTFYVPGR